MKPKAAVAAICAAAVLAAHGRPPARSSPHNAPALRGSTVTAGRAMAARYGWGSGSQWNCLYLLWMRESGWRAGAVNPRSGATGIPQLLPSVHAIPPDWASPAVQIAWGLAYIKSTYRTPCGAWAHEQASNWY